ncbi:MAG: ABC transporter substrate-binding protein [Planctomycetes bacterium]|nr:ABC transporter substrate-binding protein [Planctomycetota bacterium]
MRVVSTSAGITEVLAALDCLDEVVGVSESCNHPAEVLRLPRVASLDRMDVDAIVELRPDLVLSSGGLQAEGVGDLVRRGQVVVALAPSSLQSILEQIRLVGRLVDREVEALRVSDLMAGTFKALMDRASGFARRPRIGVEAHDDPIVVAQRWVGELVDLVGGEDAFRDLRGEEDLSRRSLPVEEAARRRPDISVLAWWGRGGECGVEAAGRRAGWDRVPAVADERVVAADDAILLRPGPRLAEGARLLGRLVEEFNQDPGRM